MTHFVTGATGLVGSYICRYLLQQGKQVRALCRKNSSFKLVEEVRDQIDWVEGDVTDIHSLDDALNGVEFVYHCAAVISFFPADRKRLYQTNVEGTANLVNVALDHSIRKFLHVSSVSAIGETQGRMMNEMTKWDPDHTHPYYSLSKFLAEREVWRGQAEGLKTIILNPSNILGPTEWGKKANDKFFRIWNGLKFYPSGSLGWVDVRDVAWLITQAMDRDLSPKRIILSSENLSFLEVFQLMANELDKPAPTVELPSWLLKAVSIPDTLLSSLIGKNPKVSREMAQISGLHLSYDNTLAKTLFDFNFTSVAEAVRDSAKAFKQAVETGKAAATLPLKPYAAEKPEPLEVQMPAG